MQSIEEAIHNLRLAVKSNLGPDASILEIRFNYEGFDGICHHFWKKSSFGSAISYSGIADMRFEGIRIKPLAEEK